MKYAIIWALLLLGACSQDQELSPPAEAQSSAVVLERVSVRTGYIYIWTDPDTGCEYVFVKAVYVGGITPRMNRDGSQRCGPPEAGGE
jgi:hypothetical protein